MPAANTVGDQLKHALVEKPPLVKVELRVVNFDDCITIITKKD